MKVLIILLSIVCLLALLIGYTFIIMHWPSGHAITYWSLGGFSLPILLAIMKKK